MFEGETDHRDVVFAGFRSWRMAFDGRYKLITGWDPEDPEAAIRHYARPYPSVPTNPSESQYVLYDLQRNEREDVSDAHPAVVESLFEALTGDLDV